MAGRGCLKVILLVIVLLILDNACVCLCRNESSSSICFEEEGNALLQLRQSLSNTSHLLSSWNGDDCCRWTGVKCDPANGHVVMLRITQGIQFPSQQNFSISSDLNSSLLNLRYLSYLELSGIIFENASMLKFIGSMRQLRYLNLSNSFSFVTFPLELGNLTKLEVLDMSGLNIAGSGDPMQVISILPSLSHLSLSSCGLYKFHLPTSLHLRYLDLSRNSFEGPIPSNIFQNITSLRHLDLSSNGFEGPIPRTIFQNMTSLRHLDLSSNGFEGPIPSALFQDTTSLRHLDLFENYFEGFISSAVFQNMISLRYLNLSWNHFEGHIPSTVFRNTTSLRYLDLSVNFFKGPISSAIFNNMIFLWNLDLSRNLFEGPIPSPIFQNLTSLQHLDLSWNLLNSSIPRWFDNLGSLVDLNLEGNLLQSIEGGLFCFLRSKPFLESLLLGHNEIHEEIIAVERNSSGLIGKNLERLDINNNFLQGALPEWVVRLKNLRILDLSHNQLHGTIPSSYGWLCLERLVLSYNQLTGNIPEAFGRSPVSSFLDLSNNLLNGTIPRSLGQLQDLHYLDLSANSLRGTLSEIHFSNLSNLSYLDISDNYLAFEVDSDWIPPFNLVYVRMMSCEFKTEFPQWIRTQVNAFEIALSNASITGPLPDWLALMPFYFLNLSYNQISGSLSKFSSSLFALDLSHNSISGPIPQDIGLGMPQLDYLYLNDNLLSGPVPTSLCEMELFTLHLGRNGLVGKIPACWKQNPFLSILDLSSNKLSGVIPSSLGNLIGLGSIHLNNNSLHGEIPVTLNNCRNLIILDLGENKISGSVPHWFGPSFQFLQILRLRENMFNGSIPPQLCSIPALRILDLAVNNLTGKIPDCLGYMKGMKLHKSADGGVSQSRAQKYNITSPEWTKEHVEQVVKGMDLDYTTLDLQLMVNLDLSSNRLIGPIPEVLTLLSILRGLNLSHNFLSGGIPAMIGDMKSLESLDLSNNHLSGVIPQSFSAFASLSKLNLSHNNFTGPIPRGNQIQTLDDPSIYADNPLLCGDPLQNKCPGAEAPQAPEEDTDEESKLEKAMFYVVIMLGFATGFWGVIGVLVYKKNWRRVYFEYVDRKMDMVYVTVAVKAAELRRRFRRE